MTGRLPLKEKNDWYKDYFADKARRRPCNNDNISNNGVSARFSDTAAQTEPTPRFPQTYAYEGDLPYQGQIHDRRSRPFMVAGNVGFVQIFEQFLHLAQIQCE